MQKKKLVAVFKVRVTARAYICFCFCFFPVFFHLVFHLHLWTPIVGVVRRCELLLEMDCPIQGPVLCAFETCSVCAKVLLQLRAMNKVC